MRLIILAVLGFCVAKALYLMTVRLKTRAGIDRYRTTRPTRLMEVIVRIPSDNPVLDGASACDVAKAAAPTAGLDDNWENRRYRTEAIGMATDELNSAQARHMM